MSDAGRGIPLLSGPPPPTDSSHAEIACRKCGKEFNMIFARARKCNHCGYSYCQSCSDYQALMPRSGAEMGYDPMNVCAFCIEHLTSTDIVFPPFESSNLALTYFFYCATVTAAGRQQLKQMSLGKLKKYISAYNIKAGRVVEKDDLIDAILNARGQNGCLLAANETYYRKYSVPNKTPSSRPRGLFSRQPGPSANPPPNPPRPGPMPEFLRPDLAPDNPPPPPPHAPRPQYGPPPQQQQYNPPPQTPPRPHSAYPNAPPHNYYQQYHTPQPPRPQQGGTYNQGYPGQSGHGYQAPLRGQAQAPPPPQYSRPQTQPTQPQYNHAPRPPPRPATQRPAQQSQPPQPPPRPRTVSTTPPPTLDQLLTMAPEAIGSLSISVLKDILFKNHVNSGQILEKSDLVKKVLTLVETEKVDRERHRQAEEREEMERLQREAERRQELERQRAAAAAATEASANQEQQQQDGKSPNDLSEPHPPPTSSSPKPAPAPAPAPIPPQVYGSASSLERTGLCVICQDEEANIAIVDCGHMAMCRSCADLVMASSRECPLCRTRIVTEARLLRIYRT
ncbi:hypothetical protein CPB84DRAFT_1686646 [Gymnopilus junonius]|uniref:RING-type domain-containing protein n=1 Tax=Gymnopilus junonius TaxID=109634 RepID=A0A9P5THR6_GYMJU|nr:hypothetical protein CPB84DRAFT_1686646 [Gymnopilus junonius]